MNEQELFNMLRSEYYPDLVKIDDEYSNFDCVSEREDMYIELKCRNTHYDELLIEKYKYDRVMEQSNLTGQTPIYICSTPSGVWEFNLSNLKIKWVDKDNLPKTTQFENVEKVVKTVGFLPISKGKQLESDHIFDEDEMTDFIMEDDDTDLWSDGETDFDPDDGY